MVKGMHYSEQLIANNTAFGRHLHITRVWKKERTRSNVSQ